MSDYPNAAVPQRGQQPFQQTLETRTITYPLLPPEFPLLTASPSELLQYGIMPRPDPAAQRELYAHWLRIFAPPMVFVEPLPAEVRAAWQLNVNVTNQATLAVETSRYAKSSNWSGAFVVPTNDTMFVLVGGVWIIPMVQLPPPAFIEAGEDQYVCSTWVGLDGQRRYLNSSLPQIGTMQTLTLTGSGSPQASALAFFQWWDRQNGGTFLQLNGLPVQPGDVMIGAVWAATPTLAIGYLANVSTNQLAVVGLTSPTVVFEGSAVTLTISGATAEWILERPTKFHSTDLYAFPDYGTMSFSSCWAGAAPPAGSPISYHDLQPARFIRLYDTLHDPTRTVFVSMAERQSDTSVYLEYGDFKD
jgi:hypothetical protein